jgi:hypothetical protein
MSAPALPESFVNPVFVIPEPASTAKVEADPSFTTGSVALAGSATAMAKIDTAAVNQRALRENTAVLPVSDFFVMMVLD